MNEHTLSHKSIDDTLQLSDNITKEQLKKYLSLLDISDELTRIRNKPEYKKPYTINVFEWYNSYEPTTSRAIAEILKFRDNNGAYPLFKLFVEKFLVEKGFDPNWINNPIITAEKDRMDICIRDDNYAIIFENKVKGAVYQPNQLARYINKLNNIPNKQYGEKNIFIVLIPACHKNKIIPKSVWRLPNSEQQCVTKDKLCWCDYNESDWKEQWDIKYCESCIQTFKEKYEPHTIVLQHKLSEWLITDCLKSVPIGETIFSSFIIQFADFLNLQYGTRENQKLKDEMEKYLREQLFNEKKSNIDNWNDINDKIKNLEDTVGLLLESISSDVIVDWYKKLKERWECYGLILNEDGNNKNFGIEIKGVFIGCWDGKNQANHKPWWGFHSENGFTQDQHDMIESIIKKLNIDHSKINNYYWNYTCNGAELCDNFYNTAIELGYLEKKD